MENDLKILVESAINAENNDDIKLNEDMAALIVKRMRTIAIEIENAVVQINGSISTTQSNWSGQAADVFVDKMRVLNKETLNISEKVMQNKQQLENAVRIILKAENKVSADVENLSVNSVFKN